MKDLVEYLIGTAIGIVISIPVVIFISTLEWL